MEVKLKIDLSDKNQRLALNKLFDAIAGNVEVSATPIATVSTPNATVAETPKPKQAVAKAVKPAEAVEEKAPKQETPKSKVEITLNDVRTAISLKAPTHRDEVVAKLKEFGAKNATTLPEENYEEYVAFLETL